MEIKSFIGSSVINDFQKLLGQYLLYKRLLEKNKSERKLMIAVDDITYEVDFQHPMIELMLREDAMPLIVVNLDEEVISQWILQ